MNNGFCNTQAEVGRGINAITKKAGCKNNDNQS